MTVAQAAQEANPFALLVGQQAFSRHTITDVEMPTLRFPTFTIDATCGERIVGFCKEGNNRPDCPQGLYVQLPPIANGVAREYNTYTEENKLMEAALKARASKPTLSPLTLPGGACGRSNALKTCSLGLETRTYARQIAPRRRHDA